MLLGATWSASAPGGSQVCDPTVGQRVVERLNAVRGDHGLGPLRVDLRLVAAAGRHTTDMVTHDFMAHEGSDGSDTGDRVQDAGYDWRYFSENVAAGQMSAEWVVDSWMESPGHRANILSERASHVGVGYAHRSSTRYGHYWTANFGASDELPRLPPGGCHP